MSVSGAARFSSTSLGMMRALGVQQMKPPFRAHMGNSNALTLVVPYAISRLGSDFASSYYFAGNVLYHRVTWADPVKRVYSGSTPPIIAYTLSHLNWLLERYGRESAVPPVAAEPVFKRLRPSMSGMAENDPIWRSPPDYNKLVGTTEDKEQWTKFLGVISTRLDTNRTKKVPLYSLYGVAISGPKVILPNVFLAGASERVGFATVRWNVFPDDEASYPYLANQGQPDLITGVGDGSNTWNKVRGSKIGNPYQMVQILPVVEGDTGNWVCRALNLSIPPASRIEPVGIVQYIEPKMSMGNSGLPVKTEVVNAIRSVGSWNRLSAKEGSYETQIILHTSARTWK